jgi:hypothetical protein
MADKKISALTAATTPLAGTEVLPIVQSGATVKVAVSDLTAGRAVSATQLTLSTGNLIVANGQGVDFSATPGTGTSELFADYEEGTFTPVVADAATGGNTGTAALAKGRYTKVGRLVTVTIAFVDITTTGMTAINTFFVRGLPFTTVTDAFVNFTGSSFNSQLASTNGAIYPAISNNSAAIYFMNGIAAGTNTTLTVASITSGQTDLYVSLTYEAA